MRDANSTGLQLPIADLYAAVLGRPPRDGELAQWRSALDGRPPPDALARNLLEIARRAPPGQPCPAPPASPAGRADPPEIEADLRVFAKFWVENRDWLTGQPAPPDVVAQVQDAAFGDAAVLGAVAGAMLPGRVVDLRRPDFDVDGLGMNDLLLVETPEVSQTGHDINFVLFGVLPMLRPGVLIRFSEVYGSDELGGAAAPVRAWNGALRRFLGDNRDYEVVFFNRMFRSEYAELIEATLPRFLTDPGSGLWLRKLGASLLGR